MIHRRTTQSGLVKMLVIFFILLLVLAVLGLNLRTIVSSPTFQDNWSFIRDNAVLIWNNYLKGPLGYFWNTIFIPLIWNPTVNRVEHMETATSTAVTASIPTAAHQ